MVLGYGVLPQILDGQPANRLLEAINSRGTAGCLKVAKLVTDKGLTDETAFQQCLMISIGGPPSNRMTDVLREQLPSDPSSSSGCHIHHNIGRGDRRVALWGGIREETVRAVDQFISGELLQRFLDLVWRE